MQSETFLAHDLFDVGVIAVMGRLRSLQFEELELGTVSLHQELPLDLLMFFLELSDEAGVAGDKVAF